MRKTNPLAIATLTAIAQASIANAQVVDSNAAASTMPSTSVPGADATVAVGAYVQTGLAYRTQTSYVGQQDPTGFEFGNARLLGRGTQKIADDVEAKLVLDFEVSRGAFFVQDVYGSVELKGGQLAIDVGQMKVPMALSCLTPESQMQFAQIAPGLRDMFYNRDRGVRLRSRLDLGGAYLGTWAAIQNGEGENVQFNANKHFLFSGRAEIGPLGEVPLSEPDLANSPFKFVVGVGAAYTDAQSRSGAAYTAFDNGSEDLRIAGDVRAHVLGFSFRGETIHGWVKRSDNSKFDRSVFAVQAGYVLPLSLPFAVEPVVRVEQRDLNDSEGTTGVTDNTQNVWRPEFASQRLYDAGVNAYFRSHRLKVQALWRRTDFLEGAKDSSGAARNPIGDAVFVYSQFGWF
jgi:hypothetical protein